MVSEGYLDPLSPEAEHEEKIKLVQKSLDISRTVMNGALGTMRLIYKHIPHLIKPKIKGVSCAIPQTILGLSLRIIPDAGAQ